MAKFHELGVLDGSTGYGNRQLGGGEGRESSSFCDNINPNLALHRQQQQQFNRTTSSNVFVAPDDDSSSFAFVLSDVPKNRSSAAHFQPNSRQREELRFPADDSSDYSSNKTLPSSSRHRFSSVEFPPSPDHGFSVADNIGYNYASSSKTLPSSRHRLPSVEFPASPDHGHYTTLPSSVVEERKLLQMVRHRPETVAASNLIEFGTPPSSPFNKLGNQQQQQTFQYQPASAGRTTRSESNESQLAQEFSLLASDLQDADAGVTMESGCLVEISLTGIGRPLYGVVRWCGKARTVSNSYNKSSQQLLVGVELEDEIDEGTDGSYLGQQYFRCQPGRAVFVPVRHCKLDSRFSSSVTDQPSASSRYDMTLEAEHGGPECPSVVGEVPPVGQFGDWSKLAGKFRGIQGHHNSCYLDATLFSMFTFTSIFDGLLFRPPTRDDLPQYEEVQRILREEIVNPLRQNHYVRADKVMKLRRLLQKLGSVTGLTTEEKDPEEFLHCLLSQTLKTEPFLKLSSGQEAYHHQLFVEKDDKLVMPSVQQLFEQSFLSSGIKLKEVPPTLIIQMPRFGKSYKMYPYVLPSSLLDITDVLENSPRQCIVCGHLAEMECQQCLGQCGTGLESISFCSRCLIKAHSHQKRTTHQAQTLQVPADFAALQEHCAIPRVYMELFAVVCIATSHYVAFVKCGPGPDAPWCFFDSMADRRGEQNGFNVPEVVPCPDLPRWLSEDWDKSLLQNHNNGSTVETSSSSSSSAQLPDHVRRLFSDAYMCLYQSPDLMLYR